MCGFAAVIVFNSNTLELQRVESMASELTHRGPDDAGIYIGKHGALAFRRLAILDLSPAGHQPMHSADGQYAMVFNGEIFNYIELRKELEDLGWAFQSSGDAEVLLTAYLAWGEACLQRFNGMYAFVILNIVTGGAFAARDRAGIKPLYYARTNRAIFIASEPKALVVATGATLDENRIANYLVAGRTDSMDISSRTYFKGVYSLKAACALRISSNGSIQNSLYWDPPQESATLASLPDSKIINTYRDLFTASVVRQMRSDVPIGITLSGGVDSSSVACVAQDHLRTGSSQQLTYFCFHSARYDESKFRDQVVARSKGNAIIIEKFFQPIVDLNRSLIEFHDEPLHSVTALANAELYRAAQGEGIKVLLGGQGADELLAGYADYRNVMLRQIAIKNGWLFAVRELNSAGWVSEGKRARRIFDLTQQLTTRKLRSMGVLSIRDQQQKNESKIKNEGWLTARTWTLHYDSLEKAQNFEGWNLCKALKDSFQRSALPDYLRIEDRNSMAYGVEARVPFLDDDLVNFAFSVPSRLKVRNGITKYIHRAAMRGVVPDALLDRPEKFGFPVDQFEIFTPEMIKQSLDCIENGPLHKLELINIQMLKKRLQTSSPAEGLRSLFTSLQATLLVEHAVSLLKRAVAHESDLLGEITLDEQYYSSIPLRPAGGHQYGSINVGNVPI
jgi:asparagine synthase (glutamine-hydrolysing)